MAKVYGEFTIPDEHVVWIGRIAETWAQFEFQIDQGIWTFVAGPQQIVACVTAQLMSVHPRLKAFIALCELRGVSEQTISELKKFTSAVVSPLSERRNRCVHDARLKDKTSGQIHRFESTAKPKIRFEFVPEPTDDLKATHREIYSAIQTFNTLRDKALAEHLAMPEASLPLLHQIIPTPKAPLDQANGEQEQQPPPESQKT